MQVSAWMTPQPECAGANDLLDAVEQKMQHGRYRRMPVVDAAQRLIGIITDHDLREHRGYLAATKVSAAMVDTPLAVGPDESIERAAQLLIEHKIGGLPVVDAERRVVGVITVTDVLRGFLHGLSGGEEQTVRIDFHFADSTQTFADAVRAVESSNGTVLGLGTFQPPHDSKRTFFLRIAAQHVEPIVQALQRSGFVIKAVHGPPSA